MAMIPENPVVGGTVLRRAAIQSPNFVSGSAGWTIKQDGSAEFNNLVIRNGQIVSGTALFYSGAAAAGNLVASIAAAAGTDSKGNAYLAGVTSYDTVLIQAANLANGAASFYAAGTEAGPWSLLGQLSDGLWAEPSASGLNLKVGAVPAQIQITAARNTLTVATQITALITSATPVLEVINTGSSITPIIRATINALGDLLFGGRVSGDTSSRIVIDITAGGIARIRFGSGTAAPDTSITRSAANTLAVNTADLDIATLGRGLQVAEGINARMGTAGLVGGTVTVPNTTVTANTRIFLTCNTPGGTPGFLRVSAVSVGVSFTILSSNGADTSVVAWLMVERG